MAKTLTEAADELWDAIVAFADDDEDQVVISIESANAITEHLDRFLAEDSSTDPTKQGDE